MTRNHRAKALPVQINSVANSGGNAVSQSTICSMSSNAASQGAMRLRNETRILNYIRRNPDSTQADIADNEPLNLTRAAVTKLIGSRADNAKDTAGRLRHVLWDNEKRPARYRIRGERGFVLSVDIGRAHARVRAANLAGDLLHSEDLAQGGLDSYNAPADAFEKTANLVNNTLAQIAESGYTREDKLAGMVLGVPFPVDRNQRIISPDQQVWPMVDLPTDLWQKLGWRHDRDFLAVESVVNLGAIAELEALLKKQDIAGLTFDTADLMYVRWSKTIDAAIIANGRPYRGFRGLAGQFAHGPDPASAVLHREGEGCDYCTEQCVNHVASVDALMKHEGLKDIKTLLPHRGSSEDWVSALVELAVEGTGKGSKEARNALEAAAWAVGRAIGTAANTLNPRVVVVGGAFHEPAFRYVEQFIRMGVSKSSWAPVTRGLTIVPGETTGRAAVTGGVDFALERFASKFLLGTLEGELGRDHISQVTLA